MAQSNLLIHPSRAADGVGHRVTPQSAGWRYVGFETRTLNRGAKSELETAGNEVCIVLPSRKARGTADEFDSGTVRQAGGGFQRRPGSGDLPPPPPGPNQAAAPCPRPRCTPPAA